MPKVLLQIEQNDFNDLTLRLLDREASIPRTQVSMSRSINDIIVGVTYRGDPKIDDYAIIRERFDKDFPHPANMSVRHTPQGITLRMSEMDYLVEIRST